MATERFDPVNYLGGLSSFPRPLNGYIVIDHTGLTFKKDMEHVHFAVPFVQIRGVYGAVQITELRPLNPVTEALAKRARHPVLVRTSSVDGQDQDIVFNVRPDDLALFLAYGHAQFKGLSDHVRVWADHRQGLTGLQVKDRSVLVDLSPAGLDVWAKDGRHWGFGTSEVEVVAFRHSFDTMGGWALGRPDVMACAYPMVVRVNTTTGPGEMLFEITLPGSLISLFYAARDLLPPGPGKLNRGTTYDADYLGGHPRVSTPSAQVNLVLRDDGLVVWTGGRLLFEVPARAIGNAVTQLQRTQGQYFGLGPVGILEASIAASMSRRDHHLVVIQATVDGGACALAFRLPSNDLQIHLYDQVRTLVQTRSTEPGSGVDNLETGSAQASAASVGDQLATVAKLFQDGLLDAEEFQSAKQRILGQPAP